MFKSSKVGTIAGCMVLSGEIRPQRQGAAAARRRRHPGDLPVSSLRRFKDDATEVREGFECGLTLGSYGDLKVDDIIETYELREKPRD